MEFTPASHEDPHNPGCLKKILYKKDDFQPGQLQMINWSILPVGKAFANHYHEDLEEIFIIMTGVAEVTVNGETAELCAGDAVLIPVGAPHIMKNIGSEDVFYIAQGISGGKGGKTVNL